MSEAEKPQKQVKLTKTLRRWDLIFFSVCAIISVDAIAGLTSWGYGATVVWFFLFVFIFLLPYGLVTAELGAAFPAEGGIYTWVRMAYGKLPASLTSIQYWIANPFWIGGSLAAVTIACINAFYLEPNGHAALGTLGSIVIGLIFVWINIIIAVVALKYGKWAANIGAWVKAIAVFSFVALVVANLAKNGLPHGIAAASTYVPSISNFLAVIGGIVFLFVGFELESGASDEMLDPQRDVPVGILRSGIITAVLYILVVGGILLTLPVEQLDLSGGLTGAFSYVNQAVVGTGGGAKALGYFFGAVVILTLISSGSVWILGSSRVQAVAALDGAAPRALGRFGKAGTPTTMAWLSGIIGSISVIGVFWVSSGGGDTLNNAMAVFLGIALSTAVLCYIFTVPAIITLRKKYPDAPRPFRIPGGTAGLWICVILAEACIILTGITLLWPGLIDNILGQEYSIMDSWGVSRVFFEVTTLGTWIAILLVGVIFWAIGRAETKGVDVSAEDLIVAVPEEA
jgi:glutamate:GABA antiporter